MHLAVPCSLALPRLPPRGRVAPRPWAAVARRAVGRRLRVWFVSDEDGLADYEYGTVVAREAEEVTVRWDGRGEERLVLGDVRYEWLGEDLAADVSANLRESRQEPIGAVWTMWVL